MSRKKVQTYELLPCPECGAEKMMNAVGNCRLDDGLIIRKLRHQKCLACGARFYTDDAMHRIQTEREACRIAYAV